MNFCSSTLGNLPVFSNARRNARLIHRLLPIKALIARGRAGHATQGVISRKVIKDLAANDSAYCHILPSRIK